MSIATKCTCQKSVNGYCNDKIEDCQQRIKPKSPKIPKVLIALLNVKSHFEKTKQRQGKRSCGRQLPILRNFI